MSLKYVQSNTLYLAGSGTIIGATQITLTSLTDIYGNVLTMSSFGDKGYITLEPDTTNEESATFTGITPNANGTYTLTGVSTTLAQDPYTETSGLVRSHIGGSKVIITDNVAFWNTFPNKENDETITGQWTFDVFPITPSNSDASTTVKGVTKLSVAPASASDPIAAGTNDTRIPVAYAVDSSGTDAYSITPSPAITAYTAGQVIVFKAGTANTGAATLNVNGLGAVAIKKNVSSDLSDGDILANQIIQVEYDGTYFQMVPANNNLIRLSTKASVDNFQQSLSAATTTHVITHNLGVIPSYVKATALMNSNISTVYTGVGVATIDTSGTPTYKGAYMYAVSTSASSGVPTDSLISIIGGSGGGTKKLTITSVTTSQLTITLTLSGSTISDNVNYLFEVFA